jgi:WD40 repeat protein
VNQDLWQDALASFGQKLRRLRVDAKLEVKALERQIPRKKTVLYDLESGRGEGVPTEALVLAYVDACLEACQVDQALKNTRRDDLIGEYQLLVKLHNQLQGTLGDREMTGSPARIDGQRVCPYPGLVAFGQEQARWFHGREALVSTLVDQLDQRRDRGGLQMVVAPSGAGKSSLLHAGLIPKLTGGALPGSQQWSLAVLTPTAQPLDALATALSGQGEAEAEPPTDTMAWVARVGGLGDPAVDDSRVLVVVDQLEELFTACTDQEQRRVFLEVLAALAAPRPGEDGGPVAVVVLGVRADFYPACVQEPVLHEALQDHQLVVGPLSVSELREAILLPAHDVGLAVEPGLVDILLTDLGGLDDANADQARTYAAERLPLLAHALRACWQQRKGATLTVAGYRTTGGIHGAIQKTADEVYQSLDQSGQRIAEIVFRRLVAIGDHTDDTRCRRTRTELLDTSSDPIAAERVLAVYTEARLLTMHRDTVQITHEALLRAWPQLRRWINTDRADRLLHQDLLDTATTWRRTCDRTLLWRGGRLQAARAWADRAPDDERIPAVTAFLTASTRQHRVGRRLRYGAVVALVITTVAAVIFAVTSQANARAAREQHALALSRQLASESRALNTRSPVIARQLAVAALAVAPTPEANTNVEELINEQQKGVLIGHTDFDMGAELNQMTGVAFSPDGSILASAGFDAVRLWSVRTFQPIAVLPAKYFAGALRFSPDGTILAAAGADNTMLLWDVRTRHPIGAPVRASEAGGVERLMFSPDGTILATAGWDNTVRLWDVRSGQPIGAPMTRHTGPVRDVAFNPDGTILASAGEDRTVQLWDARTGQPIGAPLVAHEDAVEAVTFNHDGTVLASAGSDHTVRLWNVSTGQPLGIPLNDAGIGGPLTFNRDGSVLASGGEGNTVRLWNVSTGQPIGTPMVGHTSTVRGLAFSMDGTVLASTSQDQTVRLWDVRTHRPFGAPIVADIDAVEAVAFNHDGSVLASAGDNMVQLWDVRSHLPIGSPLTGHTGDILSVAFSPDGTIAASASTDKTVRLWDVRTGQLIDPPLTGHTRAVTDVAFSPDGRLLASSSSDQSVRFWDIETHQISGAPLVGNTSVEGIAFSPDGHILASAGLNYKVQLWDIRSRQSLGSPLVGHADSVFEVVFSPHGSVLVSAGKDGALRLWDVRKRRPISSIETHFDGGVYNVAFSPDGKILSANGRTFVIRLWDPHTGRAVGIPIPDSDSGVAKTVFNSDGTFLATANLDGTVGLWRVQPYRDPIGSLCRDFGPINIELWKDFAPGEPLPKICPSYQ